MLQLLYDGVYTSTGRVIGTKILGLDLDWTLIRPIKAEYYKDASDWAFLPNRIHTLQAYRDAGYTIAIFTNQGVKLQAALNRITQVIDKLNREGIEPWIFVAAGKNSPYRKPAIHMWTILNNYVPNIDKKQSRYVGDAAKELRPQDHSSDDLLFARNIGIDFYTPEQIFPQNEVYIPVTQTMFIFVGMPGSGKTTFYEQNLAPKGWIHVNQDKLKTQDKMIRTTESALKQHFSVAVDATNPSPEKRSEYIQLAAEYKIPTMILYFVRNGHGWNDLRPHPVPRVGYNMYYKNLIEPTFELDRVPVIELF